MMDKKLIKTKTKMNIKTKITLFYSSQGSHGALGAVIITVNIH